MTRVALKGLAARPIRTVLTTLAIVLGVAMVSGSFTLTDTMKGGADSLSASAYDGTDAVVSARTAFGIEADDWVAERPTIDAKVLDQVRSVPEVGVAVGDVSDEAKIIDRDGEPIGDGPYFGTGYDARTPGADATTPFRLDSGRWAAGPGEVVLDAATAEGQDYTVGSKVRVTTRGDANTYTVVGIALFGDVKSLGVATFAVFDLATAQELFGKRGAYDSILVVGRDGVPAADVRRAVAAAAGDGAQVQTAAAHDRFTLEGLKGFISIIQVVLLVFGFVAIFVGAFTIFNTLSITVAQRSREFGLLRMVGAARRQVLASVLLEALTIGVLASLLGLGAGFGVAAGIDAVFSSMELSLPDAGMVFATRTVVVSMLVGTLVTLRRRSDPGVAGHPRRSGRGAARRVRGRAQGAPAGAGSCACSPRVVGRPAEKLGGSAGALARRNAMRHPGRTAVTASALMIGVMLVTVVTVIAAGLRDTTTGVARAAHRRHARHHGRGRLVADRPEGGAGARLRPRRRGRHRRPPGHRPRVRRQGDRQLDRPGDDRRGALASSGRDGSDAALTGLGRDGAIVDEGWATEHGLGGRRALHAHLRQGRRARPHGQGDRGVADPRRHGDGTDHDLADGLRGRVRERREPAHARSRRATPRSSSRPSRPTRTRPPRRRASTSTR